MGASYVLGRREGRFGGPEKPLSAKGLKSYLAYWCREVARFVVNAPAKKTVSVKTISDGTWIMPEDVVVALKEMGCLEAKKTASGSLVVNKSRVRKWAEEHEVVLVPVVDVEAFVEEEESELSDMEQSSEGEEAEDSA
jgi:phosphopantetheine adenylyltransferase